MRNCSNNCRRSKEASWERRNWKERTRETGSSRTTLTREWGKQAVCMFSIYDIFIPNRIVCNAKICVCVPWCDL